MPTPRTRNLSVSTMRTPGDTTASRTRSPDSDFVTARLHLPFQSRVMVSGSKRSEKNAVSTTSTRLYTYNLPTTHTRRSTLDRFKDRAGRTMDGTVTCWNRCHGTRVILAGSSQHLFRCFTTERDMMS